MCFNAGMLAEMLESIGNLQNLFKIQANTMEEQGLLMPRCWRKCWKALKSFQTVGNASNYDGSTMFINVEMLAEMLESIENISKPLEMQATTMEQLCLLIRGCWRKCWKGDAGGDVGKH